MFITCATRMLYGTKPVSMHVHPSDPPGEHPDGSFPQPEDTPHVESQHGLR